MKRKPARQSSISIHYSRLVAREIGARGPRLGLLLRGTGVDAQAFMRDEMLLTPAQQTTLALNALRLANDDGLGLRVGRLLTPETYGPLGFLVRSSPDLRTALEDFRTFLPARIPFVRLETRSDARWFHCLLHSDAQADPRFHRATIETIALSLISIVESIAGPLRGQGTMHCAYPAPDYAARYAAYFPVPVRFNEAGNELRIRSRLAAASNPIASTADHAIAFDLCRAMRDRLDRTQDSIADRVRQVLLSGPPGTIREQEVADSLFMSRRTLARRLAAENIRFKQIQTGLLAELAATELRDTRHTVDSIAALLNYHDAANFRRAFKGWYGTTPEVFRRGQSTRHR